MASCTAGPRVLADQALPTNRIVRVRYRPRQPSRAGVAGAGRLRRGGRDGHPGRRLCRRGQRCVAGDGRAVHRQHAHLGPAVAGRVLLGRGNRGRAGGPSRRRAAPGIEPEPPTAGARAAAGRRAHPLDGGRRAATPRSTRAPSWLLPGRPAPGGSLLVLRAHPEPEKPMDVQLFDTTLRDGTQSEGLSLSVEDKLKIARLLDGFGIHFIEGGYPGSNPKDVEFFQRAQVAVAQAREADRVRHDAQGGRQGRRRSGAARADRGADAGGLHRRQVVDPARHRGARARRWKRTWR